jgi:hypothetical protein
MPNSAASAVRAVLWLAALGVVVIVGARVLNRVGAKAGAAL